MRLPTWHGFVVLALAGSLTACGDDGGSSPPDAGGNPDAPVGGNPDAPVGGNPDAPVGAGLAVFADDYGADVAFAPFNGSTVVAVDSTQAHVGSASLKLEVPATEYAGGALRVTTAIDVSAYNAVTFWAKASKAATLNVVGFGNDTSGSAHQVEWNAVALTTDWTRFVIPVPASAKLTAETGLFHFAEGSDEGAYQIWFDDIRFETIAGAAIGTPRPAIATSAATKQVGETIDIAGASVAYTIDGADRVLATGRAYFDYTSSDPAVATVDAAGRVTAVAVGAAEITARLGDIVAVGALSLTVTAVTVPTEPAPAPTAPSADVIALFSDAYTAVTVDTWRTSWSEATLEETTVGTDNVKKYTDLNYVGVEFFAAGGALDATAMTHFHADVWLPALTTFRIKIVDFGANGVYGPTGAGNDDTEHELAFSGTSTPPLTAGQWVSLDLPLADFTRLANRGHLAQLVFSTAARDTVYVDNVYFHRITPSM